MGIKNIHIVLISCAVLVSGFFGVWGLNNGYVGLGYAALAVAAGLVIYGVFFLQKAKNL